MNKCPHCRYVNHAPSAFCPNCGGALKSSVAPVAGTQPGTAYNIQPKRVKPWHVLVAALVGIAIAAASLNASGLLRKNQSPSGGKLLTAEGQKPATGLLNAEGSPAPGGLLQAEGTPTSGLAQIEREKITMPQDILDYLLHVEKCEKYRVKIATEQISSAMVMLTEVRGAGASLEAIKNLADPEANSEDLPKPSEKVKESAEDSRKKWKELVEFFRGKTPPADCAILAGTYDTTLSETASMIGEVMDAINHASESPDAAITALQGMAGTSAKRIDVTGRETDRLIQGVCDKYETRKWFDVTGDVGNSGLLGSGFR